MFCWNDLNHQHVRHPHGLDQRPDESAEARWLLDGSAAEGPRGGGGDVESGVFRFRRRRRSAFWDDDGRRDGGRRHENGEDGGDRSGRLLAERLLRNRPAFAPAVAVAWTGDIRRQTEQIRSSDLVGEAWSPQRIPVEERPTTSGSGLEQFSHGSVITLFFFFPLEHIQSAL